MVLLRRRSLTLTLVAAVVTLLAYKIGVFVLRPAFMEQQYYAKQRLWARFLASCDCDEKTCAEPFNLSMMHGSLYDRLMADTRHGNRSVVKHLAWQPHKVAAAYPWRLRMYAHTALVLPRSLALAHAWWLAGAEELALALQHLSQGVPLVMDPDSLAGQRVEPDASILCKLAPPDAEEGGEEEERSREVPSEPPAAPGSGEEVGPQEQLSELPLPLPPQQQQQQQPPQPQVDNGEPRGSGASGVDGDGGGSGSSGPDSLASSGSNNGSNGDGAGGGGGGKRKRGEAAGSPEDDTKLRRFVCTLYDARGAATLLRLLSPEELAAAAAGRGGGDGSGGAQQRDVPALPPAALPAPSPPSAWGSGAEEDDGKGGVSDADLGGVDQGLCSAADGGAGTGDNCPAEWAAATPQDGAVAGDPAAPPAGSGPGGTPEAPGTGPDDAGRGEAGAGAGGAREESGSRGKKRRAGGGSEAGGGVCRNSIFIRPPRQSEVSEHVREMEASPLGLSPLQLLRASLPRAARLAGWLLLPHVMMGRYVLMLAPSPAAAAPDAGAGGGGGYGGKSYDDQLPVASVGVELMLLSGVLLTTFELLLWARVVSELLSLSRPRRSWARRRAAAWGVMFEGVVQPLREALLSWNITHFVALPLLQLALAMPSLDLAMLLPLAYCVFTLGVANSDVAARATPALLRVARRARHHEGGYHLLLLNVVRAAEPEALPYIVRLVQWLGVFDVVGNAGRAAVVAAMLEEAPGLAAALAAAAQRRGGADGVGAGDAGGGDLAAAMQARVAAAVDADGDAHRRRGADGELYDSEDEESEEDAEDVGQEGRPVVLRWPAPLQLPVEVHDWEDVPRGFTCAITQQLMTQPAMLVSPELAAAPTYERSAIQQWLAGQMRDPKSNTPLRSYSLLPNEDLHRAIDDWVTHRLRDAQRPPRRTGRARRRPTGRNEPNTAAADGAAAGTVGAALAGPAAGLPSTTAGAVFGVAAIGAAAYGSGDESDTCTRSGSDGRSASVLASLAQGASSLMDAGVEVMSRAAAAAAATAATAVAAATGVGGRTRWEHPRPADAAGPSGAAPLQEEQDEGDEARVGESDGAAGSRDGVLAAPPTAMR